MLVTKEQLIDLLRQQGDEGTARQAESELPEQIDTERDGELLSRYGIEVSDLAGGGAGLEDASDGSQDAGAGLGDDGPAARPPQGGPGGSASSSMP